MIREMCDSDDRGVDGWDKTRDEHIQTVYGRKNIMKTTIGGILAAVLFALVLAGCGNKESPERFRNLVKCHVNILMRINGVNPSSNSISQEELSSLIQDRQKIEEALGTFQFSREEMKKQYQQSQQEEQALIRELSPSDYRRRSLENALICVNKLL